jgi:hypothetical protein
MIADDFIITKDFRSYTMIILRQDKRLRDHAPTRRIRWSLLGCKRRAVGMGRHGWVGDVVTGVTRGRGQDEAGNVGRVMGQATARGASLAMMAAPRSPSTARIFSRADLP